MIKRFTESAVLLSALLLSVSSLSYAHGTKKHADDEKSSASVEEAEQMPWGIAGSADKIDRTVEVSMLDRMRFVPEKMTVKKGETVKFMLRNDGKVMHEFVIGTKETNDKHAALMVKFPGMEHDAPYMAHVEPGKTGEIVWTFNQPGEFQFACLIAGHYQAGMIGALKVSASQ